MQFLYSNTSQIIKWLGQIFIIIGQHLAIGFDIVYYLVVCSEHDIMPGEVTRGPSEPVCMCLQHVIRELISFNCVDCIKLFHKRNSVFYWTAWLLCECVCVCLHACMLGLIQYIVPDRLKCAVIIQSWICFYTFTEMCNFMSVFRRILFHIAKIREIEHMWPIGQKMMILSTCNAKKATRQHGADQQ